MRFPTFLLSCFSLALAPDPTHGQEARPRSARAAALTSTKSEIEALIERHGGRNEIHYEMDAFRDEFGVVIAEQAFNGVRTFRRGRNDFGKAISVSAVKPEWVFDWDGSNGNFAARDVIIDFNRKLEAIGVDLIVIPVPSKIEAYAREFETELPVGMPISLPRLDEMLYLLENGVEVIDVLPTVLSLMTEDDALPLYETTGHHLSGWGAKHAGALVAERLARYELEGRDPERFTDRERRAGERVSPNVPMQAWEVLERGKPYAHVANSEVVVIGDSNAFAFRTASWASHIARASGIPVTDISTSSGAPTAHARLASQGLALLKQRKAVIWIISATHMERRPWRKTELVERPSFNGLLSSGRISEAIAMFHAPDADWSQFRINEEELSELAADWIRSEKVAEAAELLRINTLAFPHSADAFGDLGRAYVALGENEKAIESLQMALGLNPAANTRADSLLLLAQLGVDYEPPAPHELSAKAIEALVGNYSLSENNQGIVTSVAGALVFEFVGQPKMTMNALSDLLFTTETGFKVEFSTKEKPTSVVLSGRGMRFEGKKR